MKERARRGVYGAVAAYVALLVGAEIMAPAELDWTRNTISRLGGQGVERGWIVCLAFIELGVGAVIASYFIGHALPTTKRRVAVKGLVAHYGVLLALCGVFRERGLGASEPNAEALRHLLCAQGAGMSLVTAIALVAFGSHDGRERRVSFIVWGLSGALMAAFYLDLERRGIWLRCMHLGAVAWLAWMTRQATRRDERD